MLWLKYVEFALRYTILSRISRFINSIVEYFSIKIHHVTADCLLVVATILAAFGWMFSKEVLSELAPLLFIGFRFILAGCILSAFGYRQLLTLTRKHCLRALTVGCVFSITIVFWVFGLQHSNNIGVGAFINSLGVILVPIVLLFFGQRSSARVWITLPIAVLGLAALSIDGQVGFNTAEYLFLVSATLFALYFSLNSRAAVDVPLMSLTAIQLLCVGVSTLLLSLVFQEPWNLTPSVNVWGWLLASVFIGTSLRFFIQTWAQGNTTVSKAALMMTLEPVWAAIIALYWFDETMSLVQLLGCTLIFIALVISRMPSVKGMWRGVRKIMGSSN